MTMQVAMKGSDGILLASDTRQLHPLALRGQYWKDGQIGTNSTKIKIDYGNRVAVACAGEADTSGFIAEISFLISKRTVSSLQFARSKGLLLRLQIGLEGVLNA